LGLRSLLEMLDDIITDDAAEHLLGGQCGESEEHICSCCRSLMVVVELVWGGIDLGDERCLIVGRSSETTRQTGVGGSAGDYGYDEDV
jgi:hypothetical protein